MVFKCVCVEQFNISMIDQEPNFLWHRSVPLELVVRYAARVFHLRVIDELQMSKHVLAHRIRHQCVDDFLLPPQLLLLCGKNLFLVFDSEALQSIGVLV